MRTPISIRSIVVAAPLVASTRVRTIEVTPLLREMILQVTRIGTLDRAVPVQRRLAGVLLDLLAAASDVANALPSPRDPQVALDAGYANPSAFGHPFEIRFGIAPNGARSR